MTTTLACMKCQRVLGLEIEADGSTYRTLAPEPDELPDDVTVEIAGFGGILLAICRDCMSDHQVWQRALQSAAELLDVCEDALADFDMMMERVPALADDPQAKAQYAHVRARRDQARQSLQALQGMEPDDDERSG